MIVLSLESPLYGSIDLNALASNLEGAQAQAGLSGLGLPGLDVQWVSGAGDGARYRGRRVLPRDIDIPIEFVSLTRAGLITQMDKLTKVLSDPDLILRAVDAEIANYNYYVGVHHVGGGDYITGKDSNGIHNMQLTITVRAGDPFWIRSTATTVVQSNPTIGPTMTVANDGTVEAPSVWTVDGPGLNLKLTSPSGEVLAYNDFIPKGGKVVIDTEAGTVVDETGRNRYNSLGAAPRFFKMKPGNNAVAVELDRSSSAFNLLASTGRINRVLNPTLQNDATGYTFTGPSVARDATNRRINFGSANTSLSGAGTEGYKATYTVNGLTPGATYTASVRVGSTAGAGTNPDPAQFTQMQSTSVMLKVTNGGTNVSGNYATRGEQNVLVTTDFVAQAETVTITLYGPVNVYFFTGIGPSGPKIIYSHPGWADQLYVGEPGDYFDGDTTDTAAINYQWTGTAHASTSKAAPTSGVDASTAKVTCVVKPRKAMVV